MSASGPSGPLVFLSGRLRQVLLYLQLCESKPQVSDDMFQGMIAKAREDLKQRQQQMVSQQVYIRLKKQSFSVENCNYLLTF